MLALKLLGVSLRLPKATAADLVLGAFVSPATAQSTKPTIVLVHGGGGIAGG